MRKILLIIALIIFLVFRVSYGFAGSVSNADPARIMFVFDASGSMWGQIDNKPKIEIAREVIFDLLEKASSDVQMGLVSYGHRYESDCEDIEVLVPMGGSSLEMQKAIADINPKGKTPLITAVKKAAETMNYQQQRSTVILISDGLDTCSFDPCKTSSELSMDGLDFTTHVIGFDVADEEQESLQCLATTTGGLYLTANNTTSLSQALNQSVATAQAPLEEIIENPEAAELISTKSVKAGSEFIVDWNGPKSRGDWITVVKQDSPASAYNSYAYTKFGSPLELTAPDRAGQYQLRYIHAHTGRVLASRLIEVTGVSATLDFINTQISGAEFDVNWIGPDNKGDYITVVPSGAAASHYMSYQYTAKGSPLKLIAPDKPGTYEVRYIMNQTSRVLTTAKLEVAAASATLRAAKTVGIGETFKVEWRGPDNKGDFITIVPVGASKGAYQSYQYTHKGSPLELTAAGKPGQYEVRYVQSQSNLALSKALIKVSPVDAKVSAPKVLIVNQQFEVVWDGPDNKSDYITIVAKGAADSVYGSYAYTRQGKSVSIYAPSDPGIYEVRYVLGGPKMVIGRQVVTINGSE